MTSTSLSYLMFIAPLIVLVAAYLFKVNTKKAIVAGSLSLFIAIIAKFLNEVGRMDCGSNCVSEINHQEINLYKAVLIINLVIIILMWRPAPQKKLYRTLALLALGVLTISFLIN